MGYILDKLKKFNLQIFASASETTATESKYLDITGLDSFLAKVKTWASGQFAPKSVKTTATIPATAWTYGENGYSYTIPVTGVTADSVVEVMPSKNATDSQRIAWFQAGVTGGSTGTNTAKVIAQENPEMDIPVMIIRRGD